MIQYKLTSNYVTLVDVLNSILLNLYSIEFVRLLTRIVPDPRGLSALRTIVRCRSPFCLTAVSTPRTVILDAGPITGCVSLSLRSDDTDPRRVIVSGSTGLASEWLRDVYLPNISINKVSDADPRIRIHPGPPKYPLDPLDSLHLF